MENPIIKKKAKHTTLSMMYNIEVITKLTPILKTTTEHMLIICFDENEKPILDCIEPVEIFEIQLGDKTIEPSKENRDFIFNLIGNDIFSEVTEKLTKKIEKIGISKFIERYTKIKI